MLLGISLVFGLLIAWLVVTAVFIILWIYRAVIGLREDEVLYIDPGESRLLEAQKQIGAKIERLRPFLIGTFVLVVVLAVLVALAWMVSGVLSVVVVGLLLVPLALLLTLLMVLFLVGGPIAWVGYGLYAAYQAYQGRDFRYWLIGEWLEREVRL